MGFFIIITSMNLIIAKFLIIDKIANIIAFVDT